MEKANYNSGGKNGNNNPSSGTPQINQMKKKALDAATKKLQREKLQPYVPPLGKKNRAPIPTGNNSNSALSSNSR